MPSISHGEISVANGAAIDFETAPGHAYTVTARDRSATSASQTFTIGINDVNETPSITSSATMAVDENAAAGAPVGSIVAVDPDTTAPNKTLTIRRPAGPGCAVRCRRGDRAVTVKSGAVLDFEDIQHPRRPGHRRRRAVRTQTITIGINDLNETPAITSTATMAVDENVAAGAAVGTVVAIDPDTTAPNNTLTYTATGGTGANLFDVDAVTGAVTVKSGAVLDFEATPGYTLDVRATDGGSLFDAPANAHRHQRPQRGAVDHQRPPWR